MKYKSRRRHFSKDRAWPQPRAICAVVGEWVDPDSSELVTKVRNNRMEMGDRESVDTEFES